MRRSRLHLLLVILLLAPVGCATWGKKPLPAPSPCCLEPSRSTDFETVAETSASPSGATPQRFEVIRSQNRLDLVWGELFAPNPPPNPAPTIDFQSEMVIVYSMGTQPNGCYSTQVTSVRARGEALLVTARELEPGPSCVCTFSIVKPFHVIRLAQREGPVSLCVRRSQLLCCSQDAEAATAGGLHFPRDQFPDCQAVIEQAEANLGSFHYRNACTDVIGSSVTGDVLGAMVAECRVDPPGSEGNVVADVRVCCPRP